MNETELQNEINKLKRQLLEKEALLQTLRNQPSKSSSNDEKLSNVEIARYSRQIILPEIGVKGQLALRKASVLIVGAGGLGKVLSQYFHNKISHVKRCNYF